MGYSTRPNSEIRTFQPDDTDDEFYIATDWESVGLSEILEKIKEKWPDLALSDVYIEAKHIHTDCLGFDSYDPGDWTNFICVSRKKPS